MNIPSFPSSPAGPVVYLLVFGGCQVFAAALAAAYGLPVAAVSVLALPFSAAMALVFGGLVHHLLAAVLQWWADRSDRDGPDDERDVRGYL